MGFLYKQISTDIEKAIARGVYGVGTRLPSIRHVRDSYSVSAATAMRAFACLEEKGLVEPKSKSGHFVKRPPSSENQPSISSPPPKPRTVSISHRTMQIIFSKPKIDLTSLASAIPSPKAVSMLARSTARVARLHADQAINYEFPQGSATLRAAISRILIDAECMICEDDVIVTNGAQEALSLALLATTKGDGVVAVESPTYFGVLQAIEALGLRALELPTDPQRGVDIDALEDVVKGGQCNVCILSSIYQNPLGFRMTDTNKRHVVELLCKYNVPLIEDDVYGPLTMHHKRERPFKSFDNSGNVIHCGSFSKTVAPSLRIGWSIPGRFQEEVLRHKFLANLSTATVPQLAIADFLTGNRFRRVTQAAARLYSMRLRTLRDAVFQHFPIGTKCTDPSGGLVLWVQMPVNFSAMTMLDRADEERISFLPGDIFSPSQEFTNCLRLSVGNIEDELIPETAARLGQLAHSSIAEA